MRAISILLPAMRELKPLLALVLGGAEVAFDEDTLLPESVTRNELLGR